MLNISLPIGISSRHQFSSSDLEDYMRLNSQIFEHFREFFEDWTTGDASAISLHADTSIDAEAELIKLPTKEARTHWIAERQKDPAWVRGQKDALDAIRGECQKLFPDVEFAVDPESGAFHGKHVLPDSMIESLASASAYMKFPKHFFIEHQALQYCVVIAKPLA